MTACAAPRHGEDAPRADVPICCVDWRSFGLEPEHQCSNTAAVFVSAICVHEHVARSPACLGCLSLMQSYGPDWHCEQCLRSRAAPHHCDAPLTWAPLECATTH